MDTKRIDKWLWLLIYGGMLGLCLGWFVQSGNAALGAMLMMGSAVAAAIGIALIFVRARTGT